MIATQNKTVTITIDMREADLMRAALHGLRDSHQKALADAEEMAARGGPSFVDGYRDEVAKIEGMIRALFLAG